MTKEDKWAHDDRHEGFRVFKHRIETYFRMACPENVMTALEYALEQKTEIDINAYDTGTQNYTHSEIRNSIPNISEIDALLFSDFTINLIGKAAEMYVVNNVSKSGLEVWRMLNLHNDPRTYHTTTTHMRAIDDLTSTKAQNLQELGERLVQLDEAYRRYQSCAGQEFDIIRRKYNYTQILPTDIYIRASVH